MATLQIRKESALVWVHKTTLFPDNRFSQLYCKTWGDDFVYVEPRGREIARFNYSDITVVDETAGGSVESFSSTKQLMIRLAELNYTGFRSGSSGGGGQTGFFPSIVNPVNGQVLQYIGDEWVNVFLDLRGDRFIQIQDVIVQNTDEVKIPSGFVWVLNGITYSNTSDFIQEITFASLGQSRIDKFVALPNGSFAYVIGEEGGTEPVTPPNTLEVTTVIVTDSSVGLGSQPVLGGSYIKKSYWFNRYVVGGDNDIPDLNGLRRYINIQSYSGSGKVTGFDIDTTVGEDVLFETQFAFLRNGSVDEIPLENENIDSSIPFVFPNGEDYILKPNEILTFVIRNGQAALISSSLGVGAVTSVNGSTGDVTVDLQSAAGEGNTIEDIAVKFNSVSSNIETEIKNDSVKVTDTDSGKYSEQTADAFTLSNGTYSARIETDDLTTNVTHTLQPKSGVLAHTDDVQNAIEVVQRTGSTIAFDKSAIYGTYNTPASGNITFDFTDAKLGMIQILYHSQGTVPTYPTEMVVVSGEYETALVNQIILHRLSNTRVEAHIIPM